MESYDTSYITETAVRAVLDNAGLVWRDRGRYLICQCPRHSDKNPSTQIFKDAWIVNCLAGCGRFGIQEAFPELADSNAITTLERRPKIDTPREYTTYDLVDTHKLLPLIPRDH